MKVMEIQNVSKTFKGHRALDDVSLTLSQGDNLALIGESGCGKTTLAKIIMGLMKPDSGIINTYGHRLQMVFQDPYQSLDPLWNIREILSEGLRDCFALRAGNDILKLEKMGQMLGKVGLSPQILGRFPHEFSGGERQRIAIARALLAGPQVLILDEAVSALDTLVQKQIMELLNKLKRQFDLTYIFISHNLRLVRNFNDKIIVMHQGKIVEQGSVAQVLQSPVHPHTQELVRSAFYGLPLVRE